jgi:hypothetical protein
MKKPVSKSTATKPTPTPTGAVRPLGDDQLRVVQGGQNVTLDGIKDHSI